MFLHALAPLGAGAVLDEGKAVFFIERAGGVEAGEGPEIDALKALGAAVGEGGFQERVAKARAVQGGVEDKPAQMRDAAAEVLAVDRDTADNIAVTVEPPCAVGGM